VNTRLIDIDGEVYNCDTIYKVTAVVKAVTGAVMRCPVCGDQVTYMNVEGKFTCRNCRRFDQKVKAGDFFFAIMMNGGMSVVRKFRSGKDASDNRAVLLLAWDRALRSVAVVSSYAGVDPANEGGDWSPKSAAVEDGSNE